MSDSEPPVPSMFPTISLDPPPAAAGTQADAAHDVGFPLFPFEPVLGPSHPWAEAVHEFDRLRADIRKLPEHREPAAWGTLLQHVRAARAEILGAPDA